MSNAPSAAPLHRYTGIGSYRIHSIHSGSGVPVVLLHGLAGSARWWRHTMAALSTRFSVHVPELAGFGSSRPAMRVPEISVMADLVRDWLTAQQLERVHLVGHSMGGQIALHVAATHSDRVKRLVLADAAGVPRPISAPHIARFLAELVPPRAWGSLSFIPTMATDALRAGPLGLLRSTRRLLADDVRPLLRHIRVPTLVLWGELDPLTPLWQARIIAEGIADAELHIIRGAAHNPMIDRPHQFNQAVLEFLDT
jgi:pimeloyl-ACP methyl ester carboxylesterase